MTAQIEGNANVMLGKPVIRGTRVPVELILRKVGEGETQGNLLDAYPTLTADKVGLIYRQASRTGRLVYEAQGDDGGRYVATRIRKIITDILPVI